jgi:alkylated DNA repair dioxygenase AlkB
MAATLDFPWQPSLFAFDDADFDRSFSGLRRHWLDERAWVDHAPGWISGSDSLFERIVADRAWQQRSRMMYDRRVVEPRLTSQWSAGGDEPLTPPILEELRATLSARYHREFDSVGFNLYRDGRDSVAWHADRISKEIHDPVVALVSLGSPRRFLLRPKGGGASRAFVVSGGDLLVTGGTAQRTWEHAVPKVVRAGPRVSLAFRHRLDPAAYARKRVEPPEPVSK